MHQSAITKDSPCLLPKDAMEVFQNGTANERATQNRKARGQKYHPLPIMLPEPGQPCCYDLEEFKASSQGDHISTQSLVFNGEYHKPITDRKWGELQA